MSWFLENSSQFASFPFFLHTLQTDTSLKESPSAKTISSMSLK